jgi:hypothetical protein
MMKKIFSSCIVYFIAGALYPGIVPRHLRGDYADEKFY